MRKGLQLRLARRRGRGRKEGREETETKGICVGLGADVCVTSIGYDSLWASDVRHLHYYPACM